MKDKYKGINDAIMMNKYEEAKSITNALAGDKNKNDILSQICSLESYYSKIPVINGLRQEGLVDIECHEKALKEINKKLFEEKVKLSSTLEKMRF